MRAQEEKELAQLVRVLRLDGVAVDYDVIIRMALDIIGEARGLTTADLPCLTPNWAKGFKVRHGLSKLRMATTDRPPNTQHEVEQDNAWRMEFSDMVQHPKDYGIGSCDLPLQPCCGYGLDETLRTQGSHLCGRGAEGGGEL